MFLLKQSDKNESSITFLLNVIFSDASAQKLKAIARFRAFRALFSIASPHDVIRYDDVHDDSDDHGSYPRLGKKKCVKSVLGLDLKISRLSRSV